MTGSQYDQIELADLTYVLGTGGKFIYKTVDTSLPAVGACLWSLKTARFASSR